MVVGTMFGDYLRRKRGVWDIDKGTPCYGNLELYAIFVPPRRYLRKRRRLSAGLLPSSPKTPPHIGRLQRSLGRLNGASDFGFETGRDEEGGSQNAHEIMRRLFQLMKKTEKSRTNLLQLPRDKLSTEMKEHSDKLMHQNSTRKKLIRTFREELGSALLEKLNKPKERTPSVGSDDSTCLSSPRTSPYNSPSRMSRDSPDARHSPYYDSPSRGSFSSPPRTNFSPRHQTPPTYTPHHDGTLRRQPTEESSYRSPNQYSPGQYQQSTPLKSSLRRVAHYASTRRSSHYLSPGDESKTKSPAKDEVANSPSPNGRWEHHHTSPHTSPPHISCVSSASTGSSSPQTGHHSHSPSSLKSPNRVSPYKSPNRVTFALEIPAPPDSPKAVPPTDTEGPKHSKTTETSS